MCSGVAIAAISPIPTGISARLPGIPSSRLTRMGCCTCRFEVAWRQSILPSVALCRQRQIAVDIFDRAAALGGDGGLDAIARRLLVAFQQGLLPQIVIGFASQSRYF